MALKAVEAPQPVKALASAKLEGARGQAYQIVKEIWKNYRYLLNAFDVRYPANPRIPEEVLSSWPEGRLRLEEEGVVLELYRTPGAGGRDVYTIKVTGVPLPPPIAGQVPWSSEPSRHLIVEGEEKGFRFCEVVALAHLMAHPKIGAKVRRLVERLKGELAKSLSPEDMNAWREFFALAEDIAHSMERAVREGTIPAELLEQWFFQVTHPLVVNVDDDTTVFLFAADIPGVAVRRRMPDGRYAYWMLADFTVLAGHEDQRLAEAAKLGVQIVEGEDVLGLIAKHAPTLAEHLKEYVTGLSTEDVLPILEWLSDFLARLRDVLSPTVRAAAAVKTQ